MEIQVRLRYEPDRKIIAGCIFVMPREGLAREALETASNAEHYFQGLCAVADHWAGDMFPTRPPLICEKLGVTRDGTRDVLARIRFRRSHDPEVLA